MARNKMPKGISRTIVMQKISSILFPLRFSKKILSDLDNLVKCRVIDVEPGAMHFPTQQKDFN
jgi:hypothetical protein